jgi:hypothetical protein
VTFDGFVHAAGGRLLDGRGDPLLMRGIGLGGWLLPEGYMWRFPRGAPQSPREIEALIADLVGEEAAGAFWRGFRGRFVSEADVARIASEGFDHVRLPLNARLLVDDAGALRPDGIDLVDRLVEWCRRHGLWIVLGLHGAPGGQTGTNIDDSPRGLPDLFLVGGAYRDRTIDLWARLAERYRDETAIAAYDLLNEPLPHAYGDRFRDDLVALYRDLTAAIRSVDPNHLLTYQGTRWSTDWSLFTEAIDPNAMLQFHKYWSPPDRPSIAPYLAIGEALALPVYMGEGGENDVDWLQAAFALYEDVRISWNLWPWKKLATWASPVSVVPPARWGEVVAYALGEGPRPPREEAGAILNELLDAVRLEACEDRPEVVSAVFHRVPVRLAPEAFGFRGEGVSWSAADGRPTAGFRADDRVTLRRPDGAEGAASFAAVDAPGRPAPRFEVVLDRGDWVEYAIGLAAPSRLEVEVGVGPDAASPPPVPAVRVDGRTLAVLPADDRARGATDEVVAPGRHLVRVEGGAGGTVVRWVRVVPVPGAAGPWP